MAIELFTGKPGAGKTNHAVKRAVDAIKEGRPVYICNMKGMDIPGAMVWEDPKKWMDLPAGSLLIVDEAQRYWRASRSGDIPEELQEAETHRHLGIDMLLTTQQPTYLHKHLRGLIMPHTHHTALTKKSSRTYTWKNRCVEDVESNGELALAEEGLYWFFADGFRMYVSTEKDTHKPKIPRKVYVVAAIFAAVIGLFWYASGTVGRLGKQADGTSTASVAAQPGQTQSRASAKPRTFGEMMAAITPRIGPAPWTAPIFDDREARSEPELYCMASAAGTDAQGEYKPAGCTCKTEQGTDYATQPGLCQSIARTGGMYNPYREPVQQQQQQQASVQPGASGYAPGRMSDSREPEQQAAYGSMRAKDYPAVLIGDS